MVQVEDNHWYACSEEPSAGLGCACWSHRTTDLAIGDLVTMRTATWFDNVQRTLDEPPSRSTTQAFAPHRLEDHARHAESLQSGCARLMGSHCALMLCRALQCRTAAWSAGSCLRSPTEATGPCPRPCHDQHACDLEACNLGQLYELNQLEEAQQARRRPSSFRTA